MRALEPLVILSATVLVWLTPAAVMPGYTQAADPATVLRAARDALGGDARIAGVRTSSSPAAPDRCAATTSCRSNSRSRSSCRTGTRAATNFRPRTPVRRRSASTAIGCPIPRRRRRSRRAGGHRRPRPSSRRRQSGRGCGGQAGFRAPDARHVRGLVVQLSADVRLCRAGGSAQGKADVLDVKGRRTSRRVCSSTPKHTCRSW